MRNDILNALISVSFGDTQNTFAATFRFAPSLPVFKGHFPGRPVLPGVFQIEMVRIALETVTKQRYSIVKVLKAKFSGITIPDEKILVDARVILGAQHTRVDAVLRVEQTIKADISIALKLTAQNE